MMRFDPILNALDVNHDGVISAEEINAASSSLLTLDSNHDAIIDPPEMRPRQPTPADRVAHMLDEFDTNKEGKLSREEVPDGMRPPFSAADKNGDGFLDSEELIQMFSSMQQSPQGGYRGSAPQPTSQPKGQHD